MSALYMLRGGSPLLRGAIFDIEIRCLLLPVASHFAQVAAASRARGVKILILHAYNRGDANLSDFIQTFLPDIDQTNRSKSIFNRVSGTRGCFRSTRLKMLCPELVSKLDFDRQGPKWGATLMGCEFPYEKTGLSAHGAKNDRKTQEIYEIQNKHKMLQPSLLKIRNLIGICRDSYIFIRILYAFLYVIFHMFC